MEGQQNSDLPKIKLTADMLGNGFFHEKQVMGFSVKTVVAYHVKISVGDMNNNSLNKLKDGDSFLNIFVVLMSVVTKGNKPVFVFKDSFFGNNGPAYVTHHIVNNFFAVCDSGIGMNIKAVVFGFIQFGGKSIERR